MDTLKAIEILAQMRESTKLFRYSPYEWQTAFHAAGNDATERMIIAGNRCGKAQPIDEDVLTPSGYRKIGDLVVGDFVLGSDGRPTKVTGVFPQGKRRIASITFTDGASVRCDYDHLWTVRNIYKGRTQKFETLSLKEIIKNMDGGKRYALPERPVCCFEQKHELPLDPYLLGLLIGDGGLTGSSVCITSVDEEIISYCTNIASEYGCEFRKVGKQTYHFASLVQREGRWVHFLKDILYGLGLMGKLSKDKRIPPEYLLADRETRLQLLRGLMDTDGTCGRGGSRLFYSVSRGLCEDVQFLSRSLGISSSLLIKNGKYKGEKHISWRTSLSRSEESVFNIKRKKDREIFTDYASRGILIDDIQDSGEAECVCISVSAKDCLYITKDFVLTHNTYTGAHEVAFHLTGLYPKDWAGRRFKKPILAWVGGITNESLRDITQKELLGGTGEDFGTGAIPKHLLGKPNNRMAGISGVVDSVKVRHVSGKDSEIVFKSYEQGWRKWQGTAPDVVWLDEEPDDLQLYTEARTRLITSKGLMMVTFTPLSGVTPLLQHFYDLGDSAYIKNVTWDDCPHLDEKTKREALESFPEHERDARSKGIPMRGQGVVFPFGEERIKCDPFKIPRHWPQIIGIDFGYDHPAATVKIALDPDNDIIYVTSTDKERKMDALAHSEKIKRMGGGIHTGHYPVAWPHDGINTEKGKGEQLIANYKEHDLNLLSMSARHKNDVGGGQSREKTVMLVYERIKTGRFKVFSQNSEWFEEFRNYHRKDGKIVDKMDDLLSATFYAIMMLRFAVPEYIAGEGRDYNAPTGAYL